MIFRPVPYALTPVSIRCGCYIRFNQAIFSLKLNITVSSLERLGDSGHHLGHLSYHIPSHCCHQPQPGRGPASNMDLVTTLSGLFLHALAE